MEFITYLGLILIASSLGFIAGLDWESIKDDDDEPTIFRYIFLVAGLILMTIRITHYFITNPV